MPGWALPKETAKARHSGPVSYTHLDVYKRQPQFLRDFPQAEEALRGAAGGSGVLPQGVLCEEAVERLLGCGVLRRGPDGTLRWIHSVHAPRPLDDVRPMASADWYV